MAASMGCCELESEEQHFGRHRPILLGTIVLAIITYILLFAVAIIGEVTDLISTGIDHVVQEHAVDLSFSPSVWIIWIFIYIWHFVIILYCVLAIFRKTADRTPVYTSPTLLSHFFYVYLSACYLATIGWHVLWGTSIISPALILIFSASAALYLALAVTYRKLHHYNVKRRQTNQKQEKWLVIVIVENGVAFYASWTTALFYLNLCVSLVSWGTMASVSSLVCLSIYAFHFVLFSVTDLTILYKYTIYVFTPYIVTAMAVFSMLVKNWRPGDINSLFLLVFGIFVVLCTVIKLIRTLYHIVHRSRRVQPPEAVTVSTVTTSTEPTNTTNETSFSSDNGADVNMEDINPAFSAIETRGSARISRYPLSTVSEEPEYPKSIQELAEIGFVPYN